MVTLRRNSRQRTEAENHLRQLEFTNQRIIELGNQVRQRSSRDAIIIIQADEGPELRYTVDHKRPRSERMRHRRGILYAMHLTDGSAANAMGSARSPVNLFRMVFRKYFGVEIELLEDAFKCWKPENYYGKPNRKSPCEFVDMTEILVPTTTRYSAVENNAYASGSTIAAIVLSSTGSFRRVVTPGVNCEPYQGKRTPCENSICRIRGRHGSPTSVPDIVCY